MAPNEQDFEQKKDEIARAALQVFADHGFRGATNAQIARAAGISPGLLYWYFKNKDDLFAYIVEHNLPINAFIGGLEQMQNEDDPLETTLRKIGLNFLKVFELPPSKLFMRLILKEVGRAPQQAEKFFSYMRNFAIGGLAKQLSRYVASGDIRAVDLPVAAQMFFGSLMSFVLLTKIIQVNYGEDMTSERIVETVVSIFLRGVRI